MKERLTRIEKMHIQDVRVLVKMTRKRLFYVSFLRQTSDKSVTRWPIGRCSAANFPSAVKAAEVVIKRTISARLRDGDDTGGSDTASTRRLPPKTEMSFGSLFWQ